MKYYYILVFDSTKEAIDGIEYSKGKIDSSVMPVPREISSGCGLALRFLHSSEDEILAFCRNIPQSCILYKMSMQRTNGVHAIKKLFEKNKNPVSS